MFTIKDILASPCGSLNKHLATEEAKPKKGKYGNKRVEYDNKVFDSKAECSRYIELVMLEKIGEITDLQHHVNFQLSSCIYEADFVYMRNGKQIVEDKKGCRTAMYRLKKKMMLNELNITIFET